MTIVRINEASSQTTRRSPTGMVIRPARPDDAPRLHAIIHAGYRGKDSWTTEHHLVKDERIAQDALHDLITEQRDKIFVAEMQATGEEVEQNERSATVMGCICAEWAKQHPEFDLPDDSAVLGLFAVDPAFQSRGVGGSLMRHAEQYAEAQLNCKRIVLHVIELRDDIIAWYARCGFVDTGKRKPFAMPDCALVEGMQFCVLAKDL